MTSFNECIEVHIDIPKHAEQTLQLLEDAGFEAWVVGGFVRDALLNRPATDIDIATNAHWRDVQSVCENFGMRTYEIGVKHGTLTVVPPNASAIEITTYRADGNYADRRHPDSVKFLNNIEEDLKRRDFTINAMAYHPQRGLLDPQGGMQDMQEKQIRIVGNPEKRFQEDALRILRACRFSSQLGFRIEESTYKAMVMNKYLLAGVSEERITHELDHLLMGDYVHDAIMQCVDTLVFVVPELAAMDGCEQVTKWHMFDVLEHTAYAVQYCPKNRLIRWAAFAHDMGKPAAAFFSDDGVEHFYGHAKVSAKIARGMTERLLMSQKFRADLEVLVLRHDDTIEPTPRSVRRAIAHLGGRVDLFRALLALKRADTMAHSTESAAYLEVIDQLERVLENVLESDTVFSVKDLEVNGDDVLAIGVPEGPQVGQLLNAALDAVMDERVPNRRKELIEFLKSIEIA
ncbi:CCA tRNA nucleotidyltransferase [Adlercreutzia sp. ZJ154]|uniref:CCA tRNA nucleotidyltransferase n=1 Tax=Adlercreutzia sp. ZJ154 TaxID=2709790 RepID=UPI0013E9EF73|nr:CCA tRNA nucleotidyltransferase [Adlercreutzia sp. ZJ154]